MCARPGGVTPTTSVADSANAQDVKDKTSGISSSMVPPKCDEPGSDECDAPVAERSRANDTEDVPQQRTLLKSQQQLWSKEVEPRRIL